jgi:putative RNA 2'-phosphotransferase
MVRLSKFLSLVLRHKPEEIGLTLDNGGWASVSDLLRACDAHGFSISLEELKAVVANNDKKRFSFSEDATLIRANQGHSIDIELGYRPTEPPATLYHGTAERFLNSIMERGLNKGKRRHVHLSKDVATALKVGQRHGKPAALRISSGQMHQEGHEFYLSENGIWLTDHVPPRFIEETHERRANKAV